LKELYPLHGIVTVLNTPFTSENTIAYDALQLNVDEALKAGVSGFLIPAMASEVQKLSTEEKIHMVDCVLERVEGKVPVFAGTAAGSLEDSRKLLKSYLHLGCKNVLIQLSYSSNDQFKTDFYRLVESGPEVVMLQDWDANGYGLPDELILELFEIVPAFRCLKIETVPAGIKYSRILELTNGKLNISGGWAVSQMPEGLRRGVHAFMPSGMHWIYTKIFRDYQAGAIDKAIELFNEILPVLAFSNQHLDISIHFFKRLLWRQGIYPTPNVRKPFLTFDHIHEEMADQLIEKVIQIENRIKSA